MSSVLLQARFLSPAARQDLPRESRRTFLWRLPVPKESPIFVCSFSLKNRFSAAHAKIGL